MYIDSVDSKFIFNEKANITNNTEVNKGAINVKEGKVYLGGKIIVKDNTEATGTRSNIYVSSGKTTYGNKESKIATGSSI